MELKCQLCGSIREIREWSKEYESAKHLQNQSYICPACQDRIRSEALNEKP